MKHVIKEAKSKNKAEILELWKSAFPTKSRSYLEFYFKHIFDDGKCLFLPQDNRIIASLQMNEHVMHCMGRKLECAFILGVATLPDYRLRGHMRYLMESALDELSHNHLITLIEAFHPKLYEPFGFQTIYSTKTYTINTHYFNKVNTKGVSHNFTAMELMDLYQKYIRHFDGAYIRDLHYYDLLIKRSILDHGNICVYRNKHHEVSGYAIYTENSVEVKISEIVYLDSLSLMKLLKFVSNGYPDVTVQVSQSEKLERLFPLTIPKKMGKTMARINHYDLFNKLYNCNVKTPKEAFSKMKKPIFLNEIY